MDRRDFPKAVLASVVGAALVSQRAEAQTCTAPCYARTDAEIDVDVTPTDYSFVPGHAFRYGATGNGSTSDTDALNRAYAACAAGGYELFLPKGNYRITETLVWDGSVDVRGESRRFTMLKKDHYGDGIVIDGEPSPGASSTSYSNFSINQVNPGSGTGCGIVVLNNSHVCLHRIESRFHGGDGFQLSSTLGSGVNAEYRNLTSVSNGRDGFRIAGHYAAYIENLNLYGNGGWGFNIDSGAYHNGKHIVCQANTAGGARIATQQNTLEVYGESNIGPDIRLTSTSVQNLITNLHSDVEADGDLTDEGTRNLIIQVSVDRVGAFYAEYFSRPRPTANIAGVHTHLFGGNAGFGANAHPGGSAIVHGGSAAGTGTANGGIAAIKGGDPVGGGRRGAVMIQDEDGPVVVGANVAPVNNSIGIQLSSSTRVLRLNKLTSTQRDALTADDGMLIYNTTTQKCQIRAGGVWVDMH